MTMPLRPYRQCHLRGALCCTDSDRRKDAYRVLALLMTLVTGTSGIAAIIMLLIELRLIN